MILSPVPSLATLPEVAANGGKVPARSVDALATRTVYASSVAGAKLDCDASTHAKVGGGAPTNNSTPLNAVLAAGTLDTPAHLRLDGFAAINSLVIAAGGHAAIVGNGWETGVFSLPGTNDCTIRSADSPLDPFDPGGTPPAKSGTVMIADLKVDGGCGVYPNGNCSTTGSGWGAPGRISPTTDGPLFTGIDLVNLDGVSIDHVWTFDTPCFNVRLNNTSKVFISNSRFESPGRKAVTDGTHVGGYCSDILIVNCYYGVGDDVLALNAEEGFQGPISRVATSNITLDNCSAGIRIDGLTKGVSKVVQSNIVGDVLNYYLVYGLLDGSGRTSPVGTNESYRLANADVSITGAAGFPASGGIDGQYGFCSIAGSGNSIDLDGVNWTRPTVAGPWFDFPIACTVDSISVDVKVIRNPSGSSLVHLARMPFGTIGKLRIKGFAIVDQAGTSYASVPFLINFSGPGSIGQVWIDSLDPAHITAFTNDFTKIGSIAGPGVATCGFTFPDSAIAPGTLYNSSTQGGLSWKDPSGTVTKLAS